MIKHTSLLGLVAVPLALAACMGNNPTATEESAHKAESSATDQASMHPGRKVFESACMSCHAIEGKPTVAPPIFAVKNHVMGKYSDRDAFIQRVTSWVKAPNADDVLMPGAVNKFGLMPALTTVSDDELKAVAEYLYDTDMSLPDWYKQHYKEEHGHMPKH